jgi:hypothetical protein
MAQAGIVQNPDGSVSVTAVFDVGDLPAAFQPKTEAQLQSDADAAATAATVAQADAEQVVTDVAAEQPPPQAPVDSASAEPPAAPTG